MKSEARDPNWWKRSIIPVPRPIPPGYMVGMRDEIRDGVFHLVEFLEPVPGYQPNQNKRMAQMVQAGGDGKEVFLSWSRGEGFTVINSKTA